MDNKLQYRMYVLDERHLSPLDKGIQSAHAICEYYNIVSQENKEDFEKYKRWALEDKTIVILNGGTVKDLNSIISLMYEKNINNIGIFHEIDLDNIVTAIAILVDEQVWNLEKYPEYKDWLTNKAINENSLFILDYTKTYDEWVKFVGGEQKVFLRQILNNRRLAR